MAGTVRAGAHAVVTLASGLSPPPRGGRRPRDNRWVVPLRELQTRPDWPAISGLGVGLLGLLEAFAYTRGGGVDTTTTFLLTLAATLPLMVRRTHLKLAATITILATLALVSSGEP